MCVCSFTKRPLKKLHHLNNWFQCNQITRAQASALSEKDFPACWTALGEQRVVPSIPEPGSPCGHTLSSMSTVGISSFLKVKLCILQLAYQGNGLSIKTAPYNLSNKEYQEVKLRTHNIVCSGKTGTSCSLYVPCILTMVC